LTVGVLRSLLKNLEAFRSLYESEGIDILPGPGGVEYSLYDIEYLYEARHLLSTRQQEAIELFLVRNIRERDVAKMMGVSASNPVASYATHGLEKILEMIASGKLPRFQMEKAELNGATPLRDSSAVGGCRNRNHPEVSGGCDVHVREVGHPHTVERAGSEAARGVQRGRGTGWRVETWHVPPGVEFDAPAPEQHRGPSVYGNRPKRWSKRATV
jgi:hypothetical protein